MAKDNSIPVPVIRQPEYANLSPETRKMMAEIYDAYITSHKHFLTSFPSWLEKTFLTVWAEEMATQIAAEDAKGGQS